MMTRRDLLKRGLITPAVLAAGSRLDARFLDDGASSGTPFKTTPFVEALPIPAVKVPVGTGPDALKALTAGTTGNPIFEDPNAAHQFFDRFAPQQAHELHVMERKHSFHPDIPDTTVWGYDGTSPGPTFQCFYGQPAFVRIFNELPANHVGFGKPSIATHLHNAHNASLSDGYPGNFHGSGTYWDHHYANALPGFSTGPTDSRDAMGTLWYHDHRQDFTAQNVYAGLVGFYLLFDERDSNNESDPNPIALRLPSGRYDIPMAFGDKIFGSDGNLVFDFFNLDGILGDRYTVNGKVQPYLNVAARKYRFRLLNGGPSRFYTFTLSDGTPLIQISNDGNLLPAPVPRATVTCGVAERHDVIVDFSKYQNGDRIYLMNVAEQSDGRGPTGKLLRPGVPLVEFRVGNYEPDPSQIPAVLRPRVPVDLSRVVRTRSWEFNRGNGAWTVNGKVFNDNEVRAAVACNSSEIWILKNGGGGWSHPIHIHMTEHVVLSRNGRTPPPWELGMKDVTVLGPGEEAQICLKFPDFTGRYVMHCHNVVHEDHAMMIRFDVV